MASGLVRTNAVTVNDVLDGHTLLEIDCVDRVNLTLSVPSLVVGGQVVSFLTAHKHNPIPSPALLERRGAAFRWAVTSFAEANDKDERQRRTGVMGPQPHTRRGRRTGGTSRAGRRGIDPRTPQQCSRTGRAYLASSRRWPLDSFSRAERSSRPASTAAMQHGVTVTRVAVRVPPSR